MRMFYSYDQPPSLTSSVHFPCQICVWKSRVHYSLLTEFTGFYRIDQYFYPDVIVLKKVILNLTVIQRSAGLLLPPGIQGWHCHLLISEEDWEKPCWTLGARSYRGAGTTDLEDKDYFRALKQNRICLVYFQTCLGLQSSSILSFPFECECLC